MNKKARAEQPRAIASRFLVGRDESGRWTVSDEKGITGGQFNDRASAVRFALAQSDHAPAAVHCLPDDVTISVEPLFYAGRKPLPMPAGRRL